MTDTETTRDYGIVIAGHGSRDEEGVREFESLVAAVKQRCNGHFVTHGFLEFAKPTIDEAARENIRNGSRTIAVVPGILLSATHAKNDMPSEVQALRREFPDHEFHFGTSINLHPVMLDICRERIAQAEAKSKQLVKREDTCLIVAGRGTTDPDANSEVSKLARILEEGMGFGASLVCYSGTAKPLVADGLKLAAKLGFRRYIVLPFFLFTGVLIKRIYAATDEAQARMPSIEFLKCDYLGLHEGVADLFLQRAAEAIAGNAAMNCSLCKYRTQMVGYEKEMGAVQTGHHFNVRASAPAAAPVPVPKVEAYEPHPIEEKSFEIIDSLRDWSPFSKPQRAILQRLVHTTGDVAVVDEIFISPDAPEAAMRALSRGTRIVTDVTMVQTGLRRSLLGQLGVETFCGVHDRETDIISKEGNITRSAAGIRRAWAQYGNDVIVAIGDAPTAVEEAIRLVNQEQWRPHVIIGLPVGFVGTRESKDHLKKCLRVPRITNTGTRGGSPWAATVVNALMICTANQIAGK